MRPLLAKVHDLASILDAVPRSRLPGAALPVFDDLVRIRRQIGELVGRNTASKSAAEIADDLAGQLGQNRVSGRTAGGKQINIDLRGGDHYDKAAGQRIDTPHVHEAMINLGPNAKINLSDKTTRAATKQDIRIARRLGGK